MTKALPILCLLLAHLCQAATEFRQWTDNEGRTMKARFIEVREANAFLQRDDGRYFEFPLQSLSQGDRSYIDKQLAAAEPEDQAPVWNNFHREAKSPEGIVTVVRGRYREEDKNLLVEFSEVSIAIPAGLIRGGPRISRTKIKVVETKDDAQAEWWRGRNFESRESDGSLELTKADKPSNGYYVFNLEPDRQLFHLYIAHWARREDAGKLTLHIEAWTGGYPNFTELYIPIDKLSFAPLDD